MYLLEGRGEPKLIAKYTSRHPINNISDVCICTCWWVSVQPEVYVFNRINMTPGHLPVWSIVWMSMSLLDWKPRALLTLKSPDYLSNLANGRVRRCNLKPLLKVKQFSHWLSAIYISRSGKMNRWKSALDCSNISFYNLSISCYIWNTLRILNRNKTNWKRTQTMVFLIVRFF